MRRIITRRCKIDQTKGTIVDQEKWEPMDGKIGKKC